MLRMNNLRPAALVARARGRSSGAFLRRVSVSFSSQSGGHDEGAGAEPVHIPVLLEETVAFWAGDAPSDLQRERFFVDGTTGFGGHSRALLERVPNARLLCIDRDPEVRGGARQPS